MATGSCLCGRVKFSVDGGGSNMTHCHCSMCRKSHGSLFATYYDATNLRITHGKEHIATYDSSPGCARTFCKHCGSPLPEQSGNSDVACVPAGLMDDDPGVRPEAHIFVESLSSLYTITDSLPQREHYGDTDQSRVVEMPEPRVKEGVVTGGCLCGAVEIDVAGTPKMMMNCHCSRCRKVKGAAHATNLFVAGDQLTWVRGEDQLCDYAHPQANVFGHAFCRTCGSSLPRARADGSLYNVPAGSLNQNPGGAAKGHIFMSSKAPWFAVTDDKPQWQEMPTY